jgi:hypothetical protein
MRDNWFLRRRRLEREAREAAGGTFRTRRSFFIIQRDRLSIYTRDIYKMQPIGTAKTHKPMKLKSGERKRKKRGVGRRGRKKEALEELLVSHRTLKNQKGGGARRRRSEIR